MIIVSNEKVDRDCATTMSYDEFKNKAFSDAGLDIEDVLYINTNDLEREVYNSTVGNDSIKFFTISGESPFFCDANLVEDWSKPVVDNSLIAGLIDESLYEDDNAQETQPIKTKKEAKVYVFGSSKGGTGKTFTSIICTYRYAKQHPEQSIALVDFDIIDGQVGVSIHRIKPTVGKYFTEFQKGYNDFDTMHKFVVHANEQFPQNVDFYLAPNNGKVIQNNDFWMNIIKNCIENYDVVIFDTGIDYLNIDPISYVYKSADKVIIVTTTSIKSVNSVMKQIDKLVGKTKNDTFSTEDDISDHLNVVITQMTNSNKNANEMIYSSLAQKCNVIATFGMITESVTQAEYYGMWSVFDKNAAINKTLDTIMA